MEWGIVLIFIPLLTLSADVMSKFASADQRFGAVIVQHLDKLYDGNKKVYHDLLERCRGLQRSALNFSSITLISWCFHRMFSSCDTSRCHNWWSPHPCATWNIVSQRDSCMFFAKLFGNQPETMMRTRLIVMTATLPTNYLPPLCHLNGFVRCGVLVKFCNVVSTNSYLHSIKQPRECSAHVAYMLSKMDDILIGMNSITRETRTIWDINLTVLEENRAKCRRERI